MSPGPFKLRSLALEHNYCCPYAFLRNHRHLSHQQFANKFGVSKSAVKSWRRLDLGCQNLCDKGVRFE